MKISTLNESFIKRLLSSPPENGIEKNVRLNNGRIYSRVMVTGSVISYDVILPVDGDILIEAGGELRDAWQESGEAFLICCDLAGGSYLVSEPLILTSENLEAPENLDLAEELWKKGKYPQNQRTDIIRLGAGGFSGKKTRILLYGPGVSWTGLSIVSQQGIKQIFSSLSTWTKPGSVSCRVNKKEPGTAEIFAEFSTPPNPEISYGIYNEDNKLVAGESKLPMNRLTAENNIFSVKIKVNPGCNVKYMVNAGQETVSNSFRLTEFSHFPYACGEIKDHADLQKQRKRAAKRRRRIIFNNDGGDFINSPSSEEFLKARIKGVAGTQVDTIFYCTDRGSLGFYSHNTKSGEIHPEAKKIIEQGKDPFKAVIDFCHKENIEIFWSMRMNDTHDAGNYPSAHLSRLKKENPEWLMGGGKSNRERQPL
ncbi:MAG: hypothetical protein WCS27_10025 [Victivallaceae bacterium]